MKAVQDRNRAFMSAVDSQLKGYIDVQQALTASDSLRRDDLAGFRDELVEVLATQHDWLNVLVVAPDGRGIGIFFSVLSALAVGFWLVRRIARPISELAWAA